jgi:hypothetical protein
MVQLKGIINKYLKGHLDNSFTLIEKEKEIDATSAMVDCFSFAFHG